MLPTTSDSTFEVTQPQNFKPCGYVCQLVFEALLKVMISICRILHGSPNDARVSKTIEIDEIAMMADTHDCVMAIASRGEQYVASFLQDRRGATL